MTRYIIRKYLSGGCRDGRKRVGIILGTAGILFDLLLFITKHIAGVLSGSVAITADAFNNLADAGAHVMALLAFPLGARTPSKRFPFGYGRLEYLSGLVVAGAVLTVGVKMLLSSVEKIVHPSPVESSPVVILILIFSVVIKAYMYRYNKVIGERIDSAGLKSVALDSVCDCFATSAIILSVLIQNAAGLNIDGWTGLPVAGCILCAGIVSAKESLAPLLGTAADTDTLDRLYGILETIEGITAVKDIAIHDYGPNRKLLTMRLSGDIGDQAVKYLKRRITEQLRMDAVIEAENNHVDTHI